MTPEFRKITNYFYFSTNYNEFVPAILLNIMLWRSLRQDKLKGSKNAANRDPTINSETDRFTLEGSYRENEFEIRTTDSQAGDFIEVLVPEEHVKGPKVNSEPLMKTCDDIPVPASYLECM